MFRRGRPVVRREFIAFLFAALLIFAFIRVFFLFEKSLRPTILAIAAARADNLATEAINRAVNESVAGGVLYQDLILLQRDGEGKIVLAQTNSMAINALMTETTLRVKDALESLKGEVIYIPLGQVSGSQLLANYGPRIPISLVPVGLVHTKICDAFEDAGINQVRHKIYFDIQADVQIVIPFVSEEVTVSTTVPLVDAVYPGEVPDTVINLGFPAGYGPPSVTP